MKVARFDIDTCTAYLYYFQISDDFVVKNIMDSLKFSWVDAVHPKFQMTTWLWMELEPKICKSFLLWKYSTIIMMVCDIDGRQITIA